MWYLNISDVILQSGWHLYFLVKSIETMEKRVAVSEEKTIEAEKELYEALVCESKVEQEFQDQKEWVDALSCSTIRSAIKLEDVCLRMAEAWKRETQATVKAKDDIAKVEKKCRARMKELRE